MEKLTVSLSNISGPETLELTAKVFENVGAIMEDPDLKSLTDLFGKNDNNALQAALFKAVPALLKNHKSHLLESLAICAGVSMDEYATQMSLKGIISDVVKLYMETPELFTSALNQTVSGSAQGSTEGH